MLFSLGLGMYYPAAPEEGGAGAAANTRLWQGPSGWSGWVPSLPTRSDPHGRGKGGKAAIWAEPRDSFLQTGQWGHFLWRGAWAQLSGQ